MAKIAEILEQAKQNYLNQTFQEVNCRWCKNQSLKDIGEVKDYVFVECQQCGFTFCPYLSQDLMDQLYARGYHAKGEKVPEHGWSRIEFLAPALNLFAKGRQLKILDFGAGQSKVPKLLREQDHRVIAVDLAEPVHPHPDRLSGNLLELKLAPDQFDLTYSFQVFEHLPEPLPIFEELVHLTKPRGYILIHTDMELPEREEGFEQWWYVLPPDHCSYFKVQCFRKILEDSDHLLIEEKPKYVIIQKNGRK